jgi:outer membrane protein assembly factor BamB
MFIMISKMVIIFLLLSACAAQSEVGNIDKVDLYIATTMDGKIHALTEYGSSLWSFDTEKPFVTSQYTSAMNPVLIPTLDGELVALNENQFKKLDMTVKKLVN